MKVLICLQTGKEAETILREAVDFLKPYKVVFAYIHTIRDVAVLSTISGFDDKVMHEVEQDEVELYQLASSIFGPGKFGFSIEVGVPSEKIRQRAEELKCDLLVLGTHGRKGLQHLLYGSVAEKVLRQSSCKTLIIPLE